MEELICENIILKSIEEEMASELFEIVGSEEVVRFMSMDPFPDEEFTESCIRRWKENEGKPGLYVYGVFEKESGSLVGLINTCGMHNGSPAIGYCFNKKVWGRGYATQALRAFCGKLFRDGYDTLVIGAVRENIASNCVIKKCGFGYVGSVEEVLSERKPDPVVCLDYRLLKADGRQSELRAAEQALEELFSSSSPFSENIIKYSDEKLPDMYDLNQFVCSDGASEKEIEAAVEYARAQGAGFVKLECRKALPKRLADRLGLSESCDLTMVHTVGSISDWTKNTQLSFRNLKSSPIEDDLKTLECWLFAKDYGEDFTLRKTDRWTELARGNSGLNFYAAYLDGRIAGSLYCFRYGDYLLIDNLAVDEACRHRYVATSLLAECIQKEGGIPFLHADPDDTPKEMYVKLGFRLADYKYNYFGNL